MIMKVQELQTKPNWWSILYLVFSIQGTVSAGYIHFYSLSNSSPNFIFFS